VIGFLDSICVGILRNKDLNHRRWLRERKAKTFPEGGGVGWAESEGSVLQEVFGNLKVLSPWLLHLRIFDLWTLKLLMAFRRANMVKKCTVTNLRADICGHITGFYFGNSRYRWSWFWIRQPENKSSFSTGTVLERFRAVKNPWRLGPVIRIICCIPE